MARQLGGGPAAPRPGSVGVRWAGVRIAIDARYIREKPSGIGTYVQALVERLPALAPADSFLFWAHPLAAQPLSPAANTQDVVVQPGPNSPLPVWWPGRYAPFDEVDLFHSPHNMMPRRLPCPAVVTVHDVMAIERPDLQVGFDELNDLMGMKELDRLEAEYAS